MSLSPLEMTVIRLAAAPCEARNAPAGALSRIARYVAPLRRAPSPLADPRLEALRILAAGLHRRRMIAPEDMAGFLAAGWTEDDVAHVTRAVETMVARPGRADLQVSARDR